MVALNPAIDAYGAAADAWAAGPGRMYNALSRAVVGQCPVALAGARVLDLGAGTGSASVAAGGLGADVIAVDGAIDMLRYDKHGRRPAAVGDARSLPVSSGSFDCVVAAFLLNHLDDPVRALREICRVLRPGGVVVASTFAAGWDHPAKAHVDAVAASYGFTPPEWYRRLKREIAPSLGTARSLASAAGAAGFAAANVHTTVVHVGLETPDDVAGWRLGMAHLATFVASLSLEMRDRLRHQSIAAVADDPPVTPEILVLVASATSGELPHVVGSPHGTHRWRSG